MSEAHDLSMPRPEHPRPDLHRGLRQGVDWLNLNGEWEFEFDPEDAGVGKGWQDGASGAFTRTIRVPFPWESHLAWGTEERAGNDDWFSTEAWLDPASVTKENYREAPHHTIGWYRREFRVPEGWADRRVWLNIGAADWDVRVWVNGTEMGARESGYMPAALDITDALQSGANTLVLRVHDPEDHSRQPIGKQVSSWYTRTSGIWQTVWLEPRAEAHVANVLVAPDLAGGRATFTVHLHAPGGTEGLAVATQIRASTGPCVAATDGNAVGDGGEVRVEHAIERPVAWTPESPHMYRARVLLMRDGAVIDEVHTQFGMRDISVGPLHEGGPIYIRLNGKPIYLRGALDQNFHPQGVYTHPSNAAIREDMLLAKQAGLNFLRLHIKTPDPRYCYWADRCGILLMCDMPGVGYEGYSEIAKERWERNAWAQIERDFNHPSIFAWCLFNETWGLGMRAYADLPERHEWVRQCYLRAKELDPTRLIEDNSPCFYDHVVTDINSWHFYMNDYEQAREHIEEVVARTYEGSSFNYVGGNKQGNEPLMNSEYGGISARAGDLDVSWCLRFLTNELRRHEKICGYVYTELTDIEWEYNGIYDYDRSPKEFGYDPAMLLGNEFVGFDAPPGRMVVPGASVRVPVFLRPSADAEELERRLRWSAVFTDWLGREEVIARERLLAHTATGEAHIELKLPRRPGLVRLEAVLYDEHWKPAAGNFGYFELVGDTGKTERDGALILTLPAGAGEASFDAEPERGEVGGAVHLLAGQGDGSIRWSFELPEGLDPTSVREIAVQAELSSARPGAPQTSGDRWPSRVAIRIGGRQAADLRLADQPADSRGALSHMNGFRGRYGELISAGVSGAAAAELVAPGTVEVEVIAHDAAPGEGGVTVYGSRAGRYPCDIILRISHD